MSRSKLKRAMLELFGAMDQHLGPMVDAMPRLRLESRTLAALLDALFQTLLRNLMTGRIRVNHLGIAEPR